MIENVTVIFLVVVFIAAEVYRMTRGERGVISSVRDVGIDPILLPVTPVNVRLENGAEITANVNCCTACLGRLKIGDQVRVCRSKEGYVVDLPWIQNRTCSGLGGPNERSCR